MTCKKDYFYPPISGTDIKTKLSWYEDKRRTWCTLVKFKFAVNSRYHCTIIFCIVMGRTESFDSVKLCVAEVVFSLGLPQTTLLRILEHCTGRLFRSGCGPSPKVTCVGQPEPGPVILNLARPRPVSARPISTWAYTKLGRVLRYCEGTVMWSTGTGRSSSCTKAAFSLRLLLLAMLSAREINIILHFITRLLLRTDYY